MHNPNPNPCITIPHTPHTPPLSLLIYKYRPSLTPSADGGGEGVQLGGRLAEEEERRVREDRQRMFALLATEAQEREAVEAALRALHHAISAAPHAPLNLTDLQRLLDAEPLARARAARGAEGEGAEMIPPAEAGAFGVLEVSGLCGCVAYVYERHTRARPSLPRSLFLTVATHPIHFN